MSDDLSEKLDKIAHRVADKLDDNTANLPDLLDGLKALTAYYKERKNGKGSDKPGNGSFQDLKRQVFQQEEDGGGD